MKTLLITAFAAVLALQVQGQKTLKQVLQQEHPLEWEISPTSMETDSLIKYYPKIESTSANNIWFRYNAQDEIIGYSYLNPQDNSKRVVVSLDNSENKQVKITIDYFRRDTTTEIRITNSQGRLATIESRYRNVATKSIDITEFTYDSNGLLATSKRSVTVSSYSGFESKKTVDIVYSYDSNNNITKSKTISTRYDNYDKELITVSDSIVTAYSYDAEERLTGIVRNTDTIRYSYAQDPLDPSITIRYVNATSLGLSTSYTYPENSTDSITTTDTTINRDSIILRYDAQGRVVEYEKFNLTDGIKSSKLLKTFKYNISGKQEKMTNHFFSYRGAELMTTSLFTIEYNYDNENNLIKLKMTLLDAIEDTVSSRLTYFNYIKETKATNVAIYANQKIAVTFNYELDPATANVKEMLQLSNNTSGLSISNAYVNAENNSQLIIELNRQVVRDESFDIAAISKLPLKNGRVVDLVVKIDGQTPTADGAVRPSQIVVSQTSAGISITAGAEIVSVKVFTASGVLAQSLQPASNEATIDKENLPAGVYQVLVTDAEGYSASQTVSF